MKKTFFLLLCVYFISSKSYSQELFSKSIKSRGSTYDNELIKTSDGGYAHVGNVLNDRDSPYYTGIVLTRFDKDLNIVSNITVKNERYHFYDPNFKIIETLNNDLIVSCIAIDKLGPRKIMCFRVNRHGVIIWSQLYSLSPEFSVSHLYVMAMQATFDNGFVVAVYDKKYSGVTTSLLKLNVINGNIIWCKLIEKKDNYTGVIRVNSITEDKNHNLKLAGAVRTGVYSNPRFDSAFIMTISSDGNIKNNISITNKWGMGINCIKESMDGDFIASGYVSEKIPQLKHTLLFKIDSLGVIKWSKIYPRIPGKRRYMEFAYEISEQNDSSFLVILYYNTYKSSYPATICVSKTGNLLWGKTFDIDRTDLLYFNNVYSTYDNGYIFSGTIRFGFFVYHHLIKLGNAGESCDKYVYSHYPLVIDSPVIVSNIERNYFDVTNSFSQSDAGLNTQSIYYTEILICSSVILPLQLLNFSAERKDKANILHWTTSNEINTKEFEIERSNDGQIFTKQNMVSAIGNSNINKYTYTDAIPLKAKNYYRIKIIDKDGKFSYSPVKLINNSSSFDILISPNPVVHGRLKLSVNSEHTGKLAIAIYNSAGIQLQQETPTIEAGISIKELNVSSLAKGLYVLKATYGNQTQVLKFIVN